MRPKREIEMVVSPVRQWTVADYYRMSETGLLHPEEQVELIAGQILQMTPQGSLHAATTDYASEALREALTGQALVRTEKPLQIDDYSEPQPDIAVVHLHPTRYAEAHPTPNQVYLLIEISDSSLHYDCDNKAKLYAQAGIEDYWVLDARNRRLLEFRTPQQGIYTQKIVLDEASVIALLSFPEVEICVKQMLPPRLNP